MNAQEIIDYIASAPKKTPVKLYVREKPGQKVTWGNAHVYGGRKGKIVFGDWAELNQAGYYVVSVGTYSTQTQAEGVLSSAQRHFSDAYVKYSGAHK